MAIKKPLSVSLAFFLIISLTTSVVMLAMPTTSRANPAQGPNPAQGSNIDPQAVAYVQQMQDYLTTLQQFKVQVSQTMEITLPNQQRVRTDRALDFAVQRPNLMRVNLTSATQQLQIFYDGKNMSLYSPKLNYYGTIEAKPTLAETIGYVGKEYNISLPIFDLMRSGGQNSILNNVQSGAFVGDEVVNGVKVHHLAFQQPNIDWQIWIEDSSTPVPRQIVIINKTQPGSPASVSTCTNWDVSPTFNVGYFNFQPPEGAKRIQFVNAETRATLLQPNRARTIVTNRERMAQQ